MNGIVESRSKRPELEVITESCGFDAQVDFFSCLHSGAELPPSRPTRFLIEGCSGRVVGLMSVSELKVMLDSGRGWPQFQGLVQRWRAERGATSSISKMAMCQAYQEIIATGPSIVPHIVRQLEDEGSEPDMWFWALKVLTHADPVAEQDLGNYRAMAKAWLDWWEWHSWEWHGRYAW